MDAPPPQHRALKTLLLLATLALLLMIFGTGCASARRSSTSRTPTVAATQSGTASYYANKFHGRRTANGERYDKDRLTAAHRTYPFGTTLRVTHLSNQKVVIVRVNDRGPFVRGRIIDLSLAAARRLDMLRSGIAPVKVEVLENGALSKAR